MLFIMLFSLTPNTSKKVVLSLKTQITIDYAREVTKTLLQSIAILQKPKQVHPTISPPNANTSHRLQ